jgi:hypothetical protein
MIYRTLCVLDVLAAALWIGLPPALILSSASASWHVEDAEKELAKKGAAQKHRRAIDFDEGASRSWIAPSNRALE